MNDIVVTEVKDLTAEELRCTEIVAEIKSIQKSTMRTVLFSSVEIGRLLLEAKEKLPHGQWGGWLEEHFAYSQTTANNFMRLYKNYGDREQMDLFFADGERMAIFGNLTPSQALALLPLPEQERREFVESHDMEKTSVRDIEAELKARKEAENRLAQAQELTEELKRELAEAEEKSDLRLDNLEEEHRAYLEELTRQHEEQVAALEEKLKAAQGDPKKLQEEKKKLKEKYDKDLQRKLAEREAALKKEVEAEKESANKAREALAEAEKNAKEQADAVYLPKLLELEERARAAEEQAARQKDRRGNERLARAAILFEDLQRIHGALFSLLEEVGREEPETADKLFTALSHILSERAQMKPIYE